MTPPTILGHEFAGIIEEVGPEVKDYKVGDRVCIDPNCYCGLVNLAEMELHITERI